MDSETGNIWYFGKDGQQHGPVPTATLRSMLARGELSPGDMVWRQGMPQWLQVSGIPELTPSTAPPPPPPLPPQPQGDANAYRLATPYSPGPPSPVMPLGYSSPHPAFSEQSNDLGQNAGVRWLLPVGRSGWAIAAGYLGLLSFVAFPAPIALIISIVAIRDIQKHPNRHGMGRAIFGLIMGILGTIFLAFLMIGVLSRR